MSYLWCTSSAILVSKWATSVKPINGVRPDIVINLTNQCDSTSLCQQFLCLVLFTRKGIQVQYMLHLFNAFKQNLNSKTHLWHIDNLLREELWIKILHFYCATALLGIQNLYKFCFHFMLPMHVLPSSGRVIGYWTYEQCRSYIENWLLIQKKLDNINKVDATSNVPHIKTQRITSHFCVHFKYSYTKSRQYMNSLYIQSWTRKIWKCKISGNKISMYGMVLAKTGSSTTSKR